MDASPFVPFDAFWLALAGLLVALAGALARLRTHHPQLYRELGAPSLLPRHGLAASAGLTRFYWSARPASLGDPTLQRWVTGVRAMQLLVAAVLATLWTRLLSAGHL